MPVGLITCLEIEGYFHLAQEEGKSRFGTTRYQLGAAPGNEVLGNGWDEKGSCSARAAPASSRGRTTSTLFTDEACYAACGAVSCGEGSRGSSCRRTDGTARVTSGARCRAVAPRIGQRLVQGLVASVLLPRQAACCTSECKDSKGRRSSCGRTG